ncbi:hypothetical protein HHI36_006216 [Cryptolaemus montrouzieri]|uniref:Actin-related protein 8 n=1 Tax=Cryptolaemus montrouzieri TaxID=559131 RepID=A0ABD2NWY4_9CUCU
MDFGSCFLVQDHVAATFGSGLSYACVIDVGDQKTSVSCVEDGICHPNTRVRLNYGGGDMHRFFIGYFKNDCRDQNKLDGMLLRKLKEEFCHVNLDICGSQENMFLLKQPGKPVMQYTIQVGDECIVAPLSLFSPELFGITGPKSIHTQKPPPGDPEDPNDENYLRDIRRRGMKENLDQASSDISETFLEPAGPQNNLPEDDIVVDAIDNAPVGNDREFVINPGQILGLDQAVLQSIDRCPNDDLKRKMYGCILVVGGGMKFAGIGKPTTKQNKTEYPYRSLIYIGLNNWI